MIKVIVRNINDAAEDGHELGKFPPSEIKPLIELAKSTVFFGESDEHIVFEDSKVVDTQFVVNEDQSFFEIIVN